MRRFSTIIVATALSSPAYAESSPAFLAEYQKTCAVEIDIFVSANGMAQTYIQGDFGYERSSRSALESVIAEKSAPTATTLPARLIVDQVLLCNARVALRRLLAGEGTDHAPAH